VQKKKLVASMVVGEVEDTNNLRNDGGGGNISFAMKGGAKRSEKKNRCEE